MAFDWDLIVLNHLRTDDESFHWLDDVTNLSLELIFSSMCLLTIPMFVFAGFISHVVFY